MRNRRFSNDLFAAELGCIANQLPRDLRFHQLLDLAWDGDREAVADLWREYGFDFEGDAP